MKGKVYFNLDSITSVHVQLETESDYTWHEAVEPKQKYFLGIPWGKTEGREAGWGEWDLAYVHDLTSTKPSSYFERYTWYRVDEVKKKVYNKADVRVNLGHKEYISQRFECSADALTWAADIVKKSGKPLEPIILT